jgi:hypothetical protein
MVMVMQVIVIFPGKSPILGASGLLDYLNDKTDNCSRKLGCPTLNKVHKWDAGQD